jgi:hypothetical protein
VNLELATQIDLWNHQHLPKVIFNHDDAIRLIALFDPDQVSSYEKIGYVEFEEFSDKPDGLLGYDLDADNSPNLKLIFAVNPWADPSSAIYYLEGDYGKPLNIFRYQSQRKTNRSLRTVEDIFFHLMYPKKNRSRLKELTPKETVLLKLSPPFLSFLKFDYFYSPPNK